MFDKQQQVINTHAALIRAVVEACQRRELVAQLEAPLRDMADNGWGNLVGALRAVLSGRRDSGVLTALDEEDTIIMHAILLGLQNPAALPDAQAPVGNPQMAAPGLAVMIRQAAHGDAAALVVLGDMAERMTRVGGEMAMVASVLRPIINGERNADKLTRNLGARSKTLVLTILEALGRLEQH